MKKSILAILACLLMLINVFAFSACSNSDLEAKLAKLESQITQLQDQNEELQANIAEQQEQITQLEKENQELEEEIAYLESQISENVVSGTFYSLGEAYERGLLTQQDLMSIAYYHNGGREGNEDIMPEDYQPQPKTVLNSETELKIKQTYKAQKNDVPLDCIRVNTYYGTYGKCVTLRIGDDLTAEDLLIYDNYTIGEINFIQFSYINVWYEL